MELDEKPSVTLKCDADGCNVFLMQACASHGDAVLIATNKIHPPWTVKVIDGKELHFCPDHHANVPETQLEELERLRTENAALKKFPSVTMMTDADA